MVYVFYIQNKEGGVLITEGGLVKFDQILKRIGLGQGLTNMVHNKVK